MFSAASKTDNVSSAAYIEDVFSTYLYTGNSTSGGTQTITNNIDLSTKGGLVWIKGRSAASDHILSDTARGAGVSATNNNALASNLASAEDLGGSSYDFLSAFNADGFTVKQGGTTTATRGTNYNNVTYTSWTFRKQPKFFDIVTWTGNDTSRAISHSLGSVPGCILVKRVDGAGSYSWIVWHRAYNSGNGYAYLNLTNAFAVDDGLWWGNGSTYTAPTSTNFTISGQPAINESGVNYVAYLFAHDAGGFGTAGTDNVISCGSFTTDSNTDATVNLGYEPQWVLLKRTSTTGDWRLPDTMRGFSVNSVTQLFPNVSNAETTTSTTGLYPTATGFATSGFFSANQSFIYIAIRRGPMKTPTSGTSVYKAITRTGTGATATITGAGFPPDMVLSRDRGNNGVDALLEDRLRGATAWMTTTGINAEATRSDALTSFANMDGVAVGADSSTQAINWTNFNYVTYFFRRAPGFMDVVCYSGTGSNTTQTHNLGVTPELIIVKRRGATSAWSVYSAALANTEYLVLNTTAAKATGATYWNSTTPTSTVFSLGTAADVNASGSTGTYVAYLFASCPGVSKVGTYSGTGGTQTISCGFAARWVMIKRTDSTGDWWFWDTTRGMVAGNDRRLAMNLIDQEVNANWVYTDASGFQIVTTDATVNASGGSYIFLAVA